MRPIYLAARGFDLSFDLRREDGRRGGRVTFDTETRIAAVFDLDNLVESVTEETGDADLSDFLEWAYADPFQQTTILAISSDDGRELIWEADLPSQVRDAYVSVDEGETAFKCVLYAGENWNGFAVPYFRRDVAEKVVAHLNHLTRDDDPREVWSIYPDGDLVLEVMEADGSCSYSERDTPSGGLYSPGGRSYCWREVMLTTD